MRYDRGRANLDPHPNYILAAFMASATCTPPCRGADAERSAILTVRQLDLLVSPRYSVDVASDLLGGALAVQHHLVKQPWLGQPTHRFPDPARPSWVRPVRTRPASFATAAR